MATGAAVSAKEPRVVLDLDALTKREAFPDLELPAEPFTFRLAGHDFELADPRDSDWKLALELAGNPFLLMRTALVGADDPVEDPSDDEMVAARVRVRRDRVRQIADGGDDTDGDGDEPEVVPALIDRFTAADLPGWKLHALFDRWHEHYKIDLSGGKGILPTLLGKTN